MNLTQFHWIILHLIFLLFVFRLVNCSTTSCSIFVSLNCSCYQSNFDLNSSLSRRTYSHLYCQGNSFNKKIFQSPFGADFQSHNRFRTISIEFFIKKSIEIEAHHFNSLSFLFSETTNDAKIEISIRFNGFTHITFNKQSFTSKMFNSKHLNKHFSLHLLPSIIDHSTQVKHSLFVYIKKSLFDYLKIESGEENLVNIKDQFKFFENSFSGLILFQFNFYIHTIRDRFPISFPFEFIFNNTNIGELHFHGSIIPPGPSYLRQTFKGLVRSLTLHRHVDTIDSNTFPYYFSVYSYTIHSIAAHTMDLGSFLREYNNLRGLELIKPRFEVSIDRFLPRLDSLRLDIEYLNERTLLSAQHIYNLKLGSSLRRIDREVLYSLPNRLKTFDLHDINLSQMKPDSLCHLIHFISNNYHRQLNIIYPGLENLTECDCARLFLDDIQSKKISKDINDLSCSKQCRFSECSTIGEYFRKKYPLFPDRNQETIVSNEINHNLPSVDLFPDPIDIDMMRFLINQTNLQQPNTNQRRLTTTSTRTRTTTTTTTRALTNFVNIEKDANVILYSTVKYSLGINDPIDDEKESEQSSVKEKNSFSWILFLIGILVVLIFVVIIVSIVLLTVRYKKRNNYKGVPVHV